MKGAADGKARIKVYLREGDQEQYIRQQFTTLRRETGIGEAIKRALELLYKWEQKVSSKKSLKMGGLFKSRGISLVSFRIPPYPSIKLACLRLRLFYHYRSFFYHSLNLLLILQ